MIDQWWSWVLGFVGVVGFILAGKKVWWAWYVNLANQILWFAYSILSEQYGFLVVTVVYTFVFTQNAISWTREEFTKKRVRKKLQEPFEKITMLPPNYYRRHLPEAPSEDRAPSVQPPPPLFGASKYGWCAYKYMHIPDEGMVWMCQYHRQPSRHKISTPDSLLPCLELDPYPEEMQEYADAHRNRNSIGIELRVDSSEDRPKQDGPPRDAKGRFVKRKES